MSKTRRINTFTPTQLDQLGRLNQHISQQSELAEGMLVKLRHAAVHEDSELFAKAQAVCEAWDRFISQYRWTLDDPEARRRA